MIPTLMESTAASIQIGQYFQGVHFVVKMVVSYAKAAFDPLKRVKELTLLEVHHRQSKVDLLALISLAGRFLVIVPGTLF